ncbi:MAG: methyltransferase [Bacillaceae bacterium]|nr:methyltransferase [Bacillaceae bacterium]
MGKLLFIKSFINSPDTIGSITPSSKKLAKKMVSYTTINENSIIVELGAGTGVITETICKNVRLNTPLIIFEKDEAFKSQLLKYENSILYEDAFLLANQLEQFTNKVDYIFCGLPLLNFSREQTEDLLIQVKKVLKPGGKLIGFQYTPLIFHRLNKTFNNTNISFEFFNIPPAFIYICEKT